MNYSAPNLVARFLPKPSSGTSSQLTPKVGESAHPPVVEILRQGLPFAEFTSLQSLLQLSDAELAPLLGLSSATLQRRKKVGHLHTPESERIVRFARLFGLATEVLESEEAAREWLATANPGTAGEPPLSWADTEYGAREVENLIGQIDHGIF